MYYHCTRFLPILNAQNAHKYRIHLHTCPLRGKITLEATPYIMNFYRHQENGSRHRNYAQHDRILLIIFHFETLQLMLVANNPT